MHLLPGTPASLYCHLPPCSAPGVPRVGLLHILTLLPISPLDALPSGFGHLLLDSATPIYTSAAIACTRAFILLLRFLYRMLPPALPARTTCLPAPAATACSGCCLFRRMPGSGHRLLSPPGLPPGGLLLYLPVPATTCLGPRLPFSCLHRTAPLHYAPPPAH